MNLEEIKSYGVCLICRKTLKKFNNNGLNFFVCENTLDLGTDYEVSEFAIIDNSLFIRIHDEEFITHQLFFDYNQNICSISNVKIKILEESIMYIRDKELSKFAVSCVDKYLVKNFDVDMFKNKIDKILMLQ